MPIRSNIPATQPANSNDNQSEFIVFPALPSGQALRANITVDWLLELQIRTFPKSFGPLGSSQNRETRAPHFYSWRSSEQQLPVQSADMFLPGFPKLSLRSSPEKLPERE